MYVYVYVYVHVKVYVYVYVCACVCTYACKHIYIYNTLAAIALLESLGMQSSWKVQRTVSLSTVPSACHEEKGLSARAENRKH